MIVVVIMCDDTTDRRTRIRRDSSVLNDVLMTINDYGRYIYKWKKRIEHTTLRLRKSLFKSSDKMTKGIEIEDNLDEEIEEEMMDDMMSDFDEVEKEIYRKIIKTKKSKQQFSPENPQESESKRIKHSEEKRLLQETNLDREQESDFKGSEEESTQLGWINLLKENRSSSDPQIYLNLTSAQPCENGGQKGYLKVDGRVCKGEFVTWEEFTASSTPQDCFQSTINVEACYCPFDYYGRTCNEFIGITCQANSFTDYDSKCMETYRSTSATRLGYPPCRPFSNNKYDFNISMNCGPRDLNRTFGSGEMMKEGVKVEYLMNQKYKLNFTQPASPPTFSYFMEAPGVAS